MEVASSATPRASELWEGLRQCCYSQRLTRSRPPGERPCFHFCLFLFCKFNFFNRKPRFLISKSGFLKIGNQDSSFEIARHPTMGRTPAHHDMTTRCLLDEVRAPRAGLAQLMHQRHCRRVGRSGPFARGTAVSAWVVGLHLAVSQIVIFQ